MLLIPHGEGWLLELSWFELLLLAPLADASLELRLKFKLSEVGRATLSHSVEHSGTVSRPKGFSVRLEAVVKGNDEELLEDEVEALSAGFC